MSPQAKHDRAAGGTADPAARQPAAGPRAGAARPLVVAITAAALAQDGGGAVTWPATRMAKITFKGNPVATVGDLPKVGSPAPDFQLTKIDLGTLTKDELIGKNVVLNIFPSIDTGVCATSVRTFNQRAAGLKNTVVVCVSKDLPFAMKRFCGAEGIDKVVPASWFRGPDFGKAYGVTMVDGPLAGLFARAVVVFDGTTRVVHAELVPEIAQEPDYDRALAALK